MCTAWASSLRRLPTVDDHGMPNREGSRVRTQPNDGSCDLLGLAHSSDRLLRDHSLSPICGPAAEAIHHRGLDDAWAHCVHTDVRLRIIESRRLSEADNTELRSAVRGLSLKSFHASS